MNYRMRRWNRGWNTGWLIPYTNSLKIYTGKWCPQSPNLQTPLKLSHFHRIRRVHDNFINLDKTNVGNTNRQTTMYHRGGGASHYPNNNTNTVPSGGGSHFNSGPGASAGTSSNNSWSNADTCASLFPRTRKLKVDIEMSLDALDTPRGGLDEVMMTRLTRDLSQFFMNIEQMQELLSKEYNQRGMWQK